MEREFDPSEVLLECEVSDGMFSNEKCVVISCNDGTKTSGFVDDCFIEDGCVRVNLCCPDNLPRTFNLGVGSDPVVVWLPTEFFHGSRYVGVTTGQLRETKGMTALRERARRKISEGRGITLDEYLRQRDRGGTVDTSVREADA